MANALNLNLEQGEGVVLIDNRIVYCQDGFGMFSFTVGSAIFVIDKAGHRFHISGHDIKCLVKDRIIST